MRNDQSSSDDLTPLPAEQILTWADQYHERHGTWPTLGEKGIDDDLPGITMPMILAWADEHLGRRAE